MWNQNRTVREEFDYEFNDEEKVKQKKEIEIEENVKLMKELKFTLSDIKSLSPYERKLYLEKINNENNKQLL